ncbi:MAG TPA: PEGA domain-containing protein [Candidatus Saccharimonadales bacterium]|nr:PEGA domain-containing protein [Candidatus Saccharimonadales bacterium]
MYKQPSKRKQLIQRVIIYTIMSLAVVGLVVALLFVVQGYQFNRTDGQIEQGGLVQFDSVPGGANVTIDGVGLGSPTATKSTLNAGSHLFTMNKNGYKQWQKTVNLAPGAVLWLNYARLIPSELKKENVASFSTVTSSVASPNEKLIAAKEDPSVPAFYLIDISGAETKQKELVFPQGSFTPPVAGKSQQFILDGWDPSSRFVLIRHVVNDTIEWLVADTQDISHTKNITALLNISISKVVFSNADSNIVYAQTDTDVRKVDINGATMSRPLVSNVAEFSLFDRSTILYTTHLDQSGARTVGYYEDGAEKPRTIKSFTDNGQIPLHIAFGKYFNEPYLAIAHGDSVEILRGSLPDDEKDTAKLTRETTVTIPGGAQYLDIRTSGRFVIAQQNADVYVYDNELKQLSKTMLKGEGPVSSNVAWLDNYMLWSNRDGLLRFYEFDGANQSDIMPVANLSMVTLSSDDTYVYAFTAGESGNVQLTRARLVLP